MNRSRAATKEVTRSAPFQLAARLGLVAYGVVHLLVAWLAVQVALGDQSGKTDKTGALQQMSSNTGGTILLWLIAAGLALTTLWQLLEAATNPHKGNRAMNAGEAILFGYLAFTAAKLAAGSPSSSTDQAQSGLIGDLLTQSWGKPVVIAIGVAIVAAGLFLAHHGLTKKFTREHDYGKANRQTRETAIKLGQVGYTALGAVYGTAGVLVVVAAIQSQPDKATGLDVALKTLAAQTFGTALLLLIAAGLAAFAVFTFLDARFRRG
jgi:hypothetical protein